MARKNVYLFAGVAAAVLATILVFSGGKADAENQILKGPRTVVWKDFLGVNAEFLWFSPTLYLQQIARLQALGLQWVRLDLHWDQLEPEENQYQIASLDVLVNNLKTQQLKSVFYLVGSAPFATTAPAGAPYQDQYPPADPNVFASRMAGLAQRYPSVNAWQVWNEPNLLGFWRPQADPAGYGKLLQASTIALRSVDSSKPVVTAGVAFFGAMSNGENMLADLVSLGLPNLGTVVSYHPYTQYPEGNDPSNFDFVSTVQTLNQQLRSAGVTNLWSTEWGWSTYKGPVEAKNLISTTTQADYVLRRIALMSALDYDRIFLFTLSDLDARASVRDQSYGLLDINANPKPVYTALQYFLQVTGPSLVPADPPVADKLPDGLYSIAWTRTDGSKLWLFWSAQGGNAHLPNATTGTLYDPLKGTSTTLTGSTGLTVPVKTSLQMLVWN